MTRPAGRFGALWHRMLMSVMGPAQVGPFDEVVASAPADESCRRCGQRQSAHEIVRDPGLTWSRCPTGVTPSVQGDDR